MNIPPQPAPPSPPGDEVASPQSDRERLGPAALLVVLFLGLAIWWPLKAGAFFPSVFLPGLILLYASLITLSISAPMPAGLTRYHWLALGGLIAFGFWTGLSVLWSPAPDLALEDALRTMIYPAAFLAGVWLTATVGRRVDVALAPWGIGAIVVTVATWARIRGADGLEGLIDPDGTLEFPFGYRNANAFFFITSALLLVGAAAKRSSGMAVRLIAGAGASACISLAILSQSRGSVLAAAAGVLVLLALFPGRIRLIGAMAAVIAPVAVIVPELLDPFAAAADDRSALPPMQQAAELIPLAALGGGVLALIVGTLADHLPSIARGRKMVGGRTALAIGATLAAAALAAVLIINPFEDGLSALEGEAGGSESRFTYTGGLNRTDFYEVALDQFNDSPLWGGGSGSFRTRYAAERETLELPRDAHSLELETLGELGAIGLGLILVAGFGMVAGAWRARRLGTEQATLSAIALALLMAWLAQASVDWFTSFPGLTAPVMFLVGAAAGPLATARSSNRRSRLSVAGAALAGLVALLAVPVFVAERDTREAARSWRTDAELAFDRLDRAAELNPLADTPLQVKAQIARELGRRGLALDAIEEAIERQPKEWRSYVLAATLLAENQPRRARARLEQARELNPLSPEVESVEERLDRVGGSGSVRSEG